MMLPVVVCLLACVAFATVHNGSSRKLKSRGETVMLGDIAYYIPPEAEVLFEAPSSLGFEDASGRIPVTVLRTDPAKLHATDDDISMSLDEFDRTDDVWTDSFADLIIVPVANCTLKPSTNTTRMVVVLPSNSLADLPHGPYFLNPRGSKWSLYRAYRLYNDWNFAFYYGTVQNHDGTHSTLTATHPLTDGSTTISVPSRLYYPPPSSRLPLSGVRIGLKDIYPLAGLRTSNGNRAHFQLYPPSKFTAPAAQRLIELGGVVVGKTRTSQFANGQAPTIDWVDYHMPFNPRGDGYRDPSSSSSGAGSATASYSWIDMNIGSDTGGSVRAPAGVSGVFGNRPSQGALDLSGVVELSREMDTAAFLTRSASSFSNWGKAWYAANPDFVNSSDLPRRIICPLDTPGINTTRYPSPGFFPITHEPVAALFESFTQGLENLLQTSRSTIDFYTTYAAQSGTDLYPPDHVGEVWTKLTTYRQSRSVFPPFFADYAAQHPGETPPLDPPVRRNFQYGLSQTDEDLERILAKKAIFQDWVRKDLFSQDCSTILVVPLITSAPSPKATYDAPVPSLDGVYLGFNRYSISQLAGVPEVVIPLGAVPFESEVTGRMEMGPVAVSLVAGYGCDFVLFDLVERLAESGVILSEVKVGREM